MPRAHAARALNEYTRRQAKRIIPALLVNELGGTTPDVTGRAGWLWIQLRADPNQLVQALHATTVEKLAGIMVAVEYIARVGWVIRGYDFSLPYESNPWLGTIASHGSQHVRADYGTGGHDPVEVYRRAHPELRGQAQTTPNMTVWVNPGDYGIGAQYITFAGGSSATIVAPAGERIDLVYLNDAGAIGIVTGVDTLTPPAVAPTPPANCYPVCWVALTSADTTIVETMIGDARPAVGLGSATGSDPLFRYLFLR